MRHDGTDRPGVSSGVLLVRTGFPRMYRDAIGPQQQWAGDHQGIGQRVGPNGIPAGGVQRIKIAHTATAYIQHIAIGHGAGAIMQDINGPKG